MTNKAKITGTRYVLAVKDMNRSLDFYKNELGFRTIWSGEGWLYNMIMLGECPDGLSAFETNNHSYFAYIEVDNIDELFSEYPFKRN